MKRTAHEVERPYIAPARYVRIGPVAEAVTGLTEKAITQKINAHVWTEGHEWVKGPDGRRYLFVPGFEAWVAGALRVGPDDLAVVGETLSSILEGVESGAASSYTAQQLRELLSLVAGVVASAPPAEGHDLAIRG